MGAVSTRLAPHSQGWQTVWLSAALLELYISVCLSLFLYVYFKMLHGGERRRKKGLVTFSFLKQEN